MPIEGRLYTVQELQSHLGDVTRQAIHQLAARQDWSGPLPGVFWAEDVEPYLMGRNIDPATLPVVDADYPDGATLKQRQADFDEIEQRMIAEMEEFEFEE